MRKSISIIVIVFTLHPILYGSSSLDSIKSSNYFDIGIVIQPRMVYKSVFSDSTVNNLDLLVRRLRLKFTGSIKNNKLKYYIQLGFTNDDLKSIKSIDGNKFSVVYDAYIDWNFAKKHYIRIGQFKLPGPFSRLSSFQELAFLERSSVENEYKTYRDIGLMLFNQWNFGGIYFKEFLSVTHGEGVNSTSLKNLGLSYTGRFEMMPFGLFSKKNDYNFLNETNEENFKMMLGLSANYNEAAQRELGTTGGFLDESRDLFSFFADMMMKYKRLSLFAEYLRRDCKNPIIDTESSDYMGYNIGEGYSFEISYKLFVKDFIAVRYCKVLPDNSLITYNLKSTIEEFLLGYTRLLFEDKLKIQADLIYTNFLTSNNKNIDNIGKIIFRLQTTLAF